MNKTANDMDFRVLASAVEEKLLNQFFVVYTNSRNVDDNNPTFKKQCSVFYELLKQLQQDVDTVSIKTVRSRYFVNERLVRFDDTGLSGAYSIVKEWKTLGMGGVSFSDKINQEQIEFFFRFISGIKPNSQNLESLSMSLRAHKLSNIQLMSLIELEDNEPVLPDEVRRQFRTAAKNTFFQAVNVVEEVMVNTMHERDINIGKTKRVVHALIDHITRDEASLIELTAIKDFDDYTYAHSTNVCIYSLTLGVRLGLDRARLSQLGFTALFHDVGKVKLPTDLINKPDAYDENDWLQMQRHPLLGAKTILRNIKFDTHTARAARGAFEHHINNDFTGYPALKFDKRNTTLFSKIISIVDTFDALTSGRVYFKKTITPDKVLKKMHYQMKIKFDPFLLKIFNEIIGIYPAGTLVQLSSDEIAVILTNNDKDISSPFVQIVGDRDGLLDEPIWVDLSSELEVNRKIVRQIDPAEYGLNIKDFILND